jgi:hypothetical protein
MIDDQIYNALLEEIRKRIPKNSVLVKTLADILFIEKEAVYRRLRCEVPFTFNEIVIIVKYLNISLNSILNIDNRQSRPFHLRLIDFINPKENDFILGQHYIDSLLSFTKSSNSEIGSASNIIPQEIFSGFRNLTKFNIFNWNYHYNNKNVVAFQKLFIQDKVYEAFLLQFEETKKIGSSSFVFDTQIFRRYVDKIKYYSSIKILDREDILKIKEELFMVLDYLEAICITGKFKETGNPVSIYISDLDITTNYFYLRNGENMFCAIRALLLSSANSTDKKTFEKIKEWIQSLIKISTLITVAGAKERIMYFEVQRELVKEL